MDAQLEGKRAEGRDDLLLLCVILTVWFGSSDLLLRLLDDIIPHTPARQRSRQLATIAINPSAPNQPKMDPYPRPFVIQPKTTHKQSVILLHGRGGCAAEFGPALLFHPINNKSSTTFLSSTLKSLFPSAKFIFPTAPRRTAATYNYSLINQWFDYWPLATTLSGEDCTATSSPVTDKLHIAINGLAETAGFLHDLIRDEAALVGCQNVVLGGLSQGGAASIVAGLLWDDRKEGPLGGIFGLCSWLPFAGKMKDLSVSALKDEASGYGDAPAARAIEHLQNELQLPSTSSASTNRYPYSSSSLLAESTPFFLGHGLEDEKILVQFGREAAACLRAMGLPVVWKEYAALNHWYSETMLRDLAEFLMGILDEA